MLYEQTVENTTLEILIKLMNDISFHDFILVGGTALALQIGHRKSIDLDLFINIPFDENLLVDQLRKEYNFELDFISTNTIKGEINGIKIDCIAHQYPWLELKNISDSIRLAGFKDIAAMKLNAISGNGTRLKDFTDIAFLSTQLTLNQMLQAYEQKYKSNPVMPLKAITYFDDINFNEPIVMTSAQFKWECIEKRIFEMLKSPNMLFDKIEM